MTRTKTLLTPTLFNVMLESVHFLGETICGTILFKVGVMVGIFLGKMKIWQVQMKRQESEEHKPQYAKKMVLKL